MRRLPLVASALLLALAAGAARADEPLWELGIGVGALRLPHYRGSDRSNAWVLPVPYFVYRGEFLRADRSGARALLFESERVDFDLSASASPPVSSDDGSARDGMPDLKPTFEIGPKLNLKLARGDGWKVDLRLPVRSVITLQSHPRSIGWSAEPVINLDVQWQGWNFGSQTGPLFGSRRLHGYFYDVAPAYATAQRPDYQAPGGYGGWQATLAASKRFPRFWFGTYVRGDTVRGAAFAPSPLVDARQTWSAGIVASWIFAVSDARVPDRR